MTHAGGGGMCDCGDESSWAPAGFCRNHRGRSATVDVPSCSLPEHTSTVISEFVRLAALSLLHTDGHFAVDDSIPTYDGGYVGVLFNDDVHSFDSVVSHLQHVTGLTRRGATTTALVVDLFGQSVFFRGSMQQCQDAVDSITERVGVDASVQNLPAFLIKESRLIRLLDILTDLCSCSDLLRDAVGRSLTTTTTSTLGDGHAIPLVSAIMRVSAILQRELSQAVGRLHFQLFVDAEFKEYFTMVFTRDYSRLLTSARHARHSRTRSVLDYSVQLYTIPDMVLRLCREQDLLSVFLSNFRNWFLDHLEESNLDARPFSDLQYILRNHGVLEFVISERVDLLQSWLDILRVAEGIDSQRRECGPNHVEYESLAWYGAFAITASLFLVTRVLRDDIMPLWAKEHLDTVIRPLVSRFMSDWSSQPREDRVDLGNGFSAARCDIVNGGPVSLHFPLRRFLMELVGTFCVQTGTSLSECLPGPDDAVALVDELIRACAFTCHARASLWVRNGNFIIQQAVAYSRSGTFRSAMFAGDLFGMQCAAVRLGAAPFLSLMSYRFAIHDVLEIGTGNLPSFAVIRESWDPEKVNYTVEAFVEVFITVLTDRGHLRHQHDHELWSLRRNVVHCLLLGEATYSEVLQFFGVEQPPEYLDDMLDEVAVYIVPRDMESGKYRVRDSAALEHFDPFFAHYSDVQKQQAQDNFSKLMSSRGHDIGSRRIPPLPVVAPPFLPLLDIVVSCDVVALVRKLLTMNPGPRLLSSALYLVSLAINDITHNGVASDAWAAAIVQSGDDHSVLRTLCQIVVLSETHNEASNGLLAVKAERHHVDEVRLILKDLRELSEDCRAVIDSYQFRPTPPKESHAQAAERTARRDAARARALARIQHQSETFSNTHREHLVVVDEAAQQQRSHLHSCILCRSNHSQEEMGLLAWIGRCEIRSLLEAPERRCRKRPRVPRPSDRFVRYSRDCGHAMHSSCYASYVSSLLGRKSSRQHYEGEFVVNISVGEITCPLCKCHANVLLPIDPPTSEVSAEFDDVRDDGGTSDEQWFETYSSALLSRLSDKAGRLTPAPLLSPGSEALYIQLNDRFRSFSNDDNAVVRLVASDIGIAEIQWRARTYAPDKDLDHIRLLIRSASVVVRRQLFAGTLSLTPFEIDAKQCTTIDCIARYAILLLAIGLTNEQALCVIRRLIRVGCRTAPSLAFARQASILCCTMPGNAILLPASDDELADVLGVAVPLETALTVPYLSPLPTEFLELFNKHAFSVCVECGKRPKTAALCLVCGDLLCAGRDCSVPSLGGGALSVHTSLYCGEQAAFLLLSQCSVVLIANGYSCDFISPYLDAHGEEDVGLQRGRPLFLDADRWQRIQQLVTNLEIGSFVSRKRSYQHDLFPRNHF
ncbi:hypothetical protein PBRA_008722 [Plasmodiophora brassicae]|nr:hypothetical protein PBRA_008722 [Plasmodiophora brassicae]